jgi:hypothetical protein
MRGGADRLLLGAPDGSIYDWLGSKPAGWVGRGRYGYRWPRSVGDTQISPLYPNDGSALAGSDSTPSDVLYMFHAHGATQPLP